VMLASSLVATLGVRGRLTREDLRTIPIVRRLIAPPPKPEPGLSPAAVKEAADLDQSSKLLLSAGAVSLDDLAVLASEMQTVKERYEKELAALDARRESFEDERRDLGFRRRRVEQLMRDAESARAALAEERVELRDAQVFVDAKAAKNTKKLAKLYEGMKPQAAAERLAGLGDDTIAQLLSFMRPRSASKTLERMTPARVRAISDRYRHLMDERLKTRLAAFRDAGKASPKATSPERKPPPAAAPTAPPAAADGSRPAGGPAAAKPDA